MVATDTACSAKSLRSDQEATMKLKLNSATELAALLTAAAIISAGINTTQSHATVKRKHNERGSVYYDGPNGPNISYQSGPGVVFGALREIARRGGRVAKDSLLFYRLAKSKSLFLSPETLSTKLLLCLPILQDSGDRKSS